VTLQVGSRFPCRDRSTLGRQGTIREDTLFYFAYTARIAPDRMAEVCPDAAFSFIAHLPEYGLSFPIDGNGWSGGLPSATPASGSTVWGAVYTVNEASMPSLDAIERHEGRVRASLQAIDRMGKRHVVATHVAPEAAGATRAPSARYVTIMLSGSRHWSLPAGWIAGLEEHLDVGR